MLLDDHRWFSRNVIFHRFCRSSLGHMIIVTWRRVLRTPLPLPEGAMQVNMSRHFGLRRSCKKWQAATNLRTHDQTIKKKRKKHSKTTSLPHYHLHHSSCFPPLKMHAQVSVLTLILVIVVEVIWAQRDSFSPDETKLDASGSAMVSTECGSCTSSVKNKTGFAHYPMLQSDLLSFWSTKQVFFLHCIWTASLCNFKSIECWAAL